MCFTSASDMHGQSFYQHYFEINMRIMANTRKACTVFVFESGNFFRKQSRTTLPTVGLHYLWGFHFWNTRGYQNLQLVKPVDEAHRGHPQLPTVSVVLRMPVLEGEKLILDFEEYRK